MPVFLDNPAGRAHALLTHYKLSASQGGTFREAWMHALGLATVDEVPDALGDVRGLMWEVIGVANALNVPGYEDIPADVRILFDACVAPTTVPLEGAAHVAIPPDLAMKGLGMFAGYLHATNPDGDVPDEEERAELIQQVQAIMADVVAADMPHDVSRAILQRLREILAALQHIEVGGPGAARLAAEALAASALTQNPDEVEHAIREQMLQVATKVYNAVKRAGVVGGSIVALVSAGEALGLSPAPEPLQLNPGPAVVQPHEPEAAPPADEAPVVDDDDAVPA